MGDRANIAIEQGDETRVWLYTHWTGTELPKTLQSALMRGEERWHDTQYLARIIFDEMTGGDKSLTGYGITTCMYDNDYPILVVDPNKAMVTIEMAPRRGTDNRCIGKTFSFEAFCAIAKMSWNTLNEIAV
jgi:hypothetical protein